MSWWVAWAKLEDTENDCSECERTRSRVMNRDCRVCGEGVEAKDSQFATPPEFKWEEHGQVGEEEGGGEQDQLEWIQLEESNDLSANQQTLGGEDGQGREEEQ